LKVFTIKEISEIVDGKVYGDPDVKIKNVAEIDKAQKGDITFLSNPKYKKFLNTTKASCIIVSETNIIKGKNLIVTKDPYLAFALFVRHITPKRELPFSGISPEARISENVKLGDRAIVAPFVFIGDDTKIGSNTVIYPNVYIDKNVRIGENCVIYSNVVIRDETRIGNNVMIESGSVIGSDGFGFVQHNGKYEKIPQIGKVIIEDEVEIGANCCIDRASIGETVIKKGTKLDNMVHIAHNIEIGENTVIAAQTGISGSTKIGKNVQIGGQAGFAGHLSIGDGAKIGGQAGVTKSVSPKVAVTGYPARPIKEQKRIEAILSQLPDLWKKILKKL